MTRVGLVSARVPAATACAAWLLAALVIGGLAPPGASAGMRTHPIMPLGDGTGAPLGDAHLRTDSLDGDVSVEMTAPAVDLPPGAELRLVSCVQTHVLGSAPSAACSERDIDTRRATDATTAAAPAATRQIPVPPAAERAWATGVVELLRRTSTGRWERTASSWTAGSLASAALPLPEAAFPDPLDPQGVALDSIADGGMNTAGRDSICSPASSLVLAIAGRAHSRRIGAGGSLRIQVRTVRDGMLHVSIRMAGRTVARVRRTALRGRSTTLALRLDRRARAELRRARRPPPLRVTAALHDRRGSLLHTVSRTATLVRGTRGGRARGDQRHGDAHERPV